MLSVLFAKARSLDKLKSSMMLEISERYHILLFPGLNRLKFLIQATHTIEPLLAIVRDIYRELAIETVPGFVDELPGGFVFHSRFIPDWIRIVNLYLAGILTLIDF